MANIQFISNQHDLFMRLQACKRCIFTFNRQRICNFAFKMREVECLPFMNFAH